MVVNLFCDTVIVAVISRKVSAYDKYLNTSKLFTTTVCVVEQIMDRNVP